MNFNAPRSQIKVLLVSIAMLILFGTLDYFMGRLSFQAAYLVPILLVSWYVSRRAGILLSIASILSRVVPDLVREPSRVMSYVDCWNVAGETVIYLSLAFAISILKDRLAREKILARTDYLTGLANSRYFYEAADREIACSHREGRLLSLAYLDLDGFKTFNDDYGHSVGDNLLLTVADAIRQSLRPGDLAARLGGDEFAILLPETGPEDLVILIKRVQRRLAQAMAANGWPVSSSIGVVSSLAPPRKVDRLLMAADRLMYAAKKEGKNRANFGLMNDWEEE